jgi:hypothetical protein
MAGVIIIAKSLSVGVEAALRNRQKAAKLALLLYPIMFVLACSELPELTSLRDDPSNDYHCEILSNSIKAQPQISIEKVTGAHFPVLRNAQCHCQRVFRLALAGDKPQTTPQDLLHQICIHRT